MGLAKLFTQIFFARWQAFVKNNKNSSWQITYVYFMMILSSLPYLTVIREYFSFQTSVLIFLKSYYENKGHLNTENHIASIIRFLTFQMLTLQIQLSSKEQSRGQAKIGYDCLMNCRNKVDGLLENIFNGEYGSELEDRLELEALQLLEYKQLISLAHHKWWCARQLIYHSCSQAAYAVKRWIQIKYLPDDQNDVSVSKINYGDCFSQQYVVVLNNTKKR